MLKKHTISFKHAFNGILAATTTQPNIRIHFGVAIFITAMGVFFQLDTISWVLLVITYSLVITAEMVNTAIEFACNAITREQNKDIQFAKDIAAGAVLVTAIFAIITGILIFWPKLQTYLLGNS